ncbi:ATP-binding protein [Streptomyces antimycoticus]|uniref:Orc1-like AAA ATPase domain-containing protein n=1 Tax=Streptomyces antimycoticus TaxID=68175 RepID=A0A4D4KC28_9ACTN|nr:ATP-binding protein [Streptomyces antimycoticus]GDY46525.1 hypothetical protein SANT12839_074070 [Streptomyces antimycoticus]
METSVQARNLQMINIHTNRQLHLPVPHQLRPVPATFTDRTRMLREMTRRLADQPRDSARIISIGGVAGVGKTAFATRLLHDLSDEFPGGQLQVDWRGYSPKGQATMAETLGRLLRATWPGELCGDAEELAVWWRSITAERQPISLLVDKAVRADHVRALLPGVRGMWW